MKEYRLHIGDLVATKSPAIYSCLGLGSCIGLFLHDRATGISGGAHMLIPYERTPGSFGTHGSIQRAVGELLRQFSELGSTLANVRAKITGGANVVRVGTAIGAQNATAVLTELTERRIYVAALDVGGTVSRSARYFTETEALFVRLAGSKEVKVF